MNTLLEKIESYGFSCEAGPLANCADWVDLKAALSGNEASVLRFERLGYLPDQGRIDVVAAIDYDVMRARGEKAEAELAELRRVK